MDTGFVALDETGKVLLAREFNLEKRSKSTTEEILSYARDLVDMIPYESKVAIEHFAYSARGDQVSFQYAVGYAIRFAMIDANIKYVEASPTMIKKFVCGVGKGNAKKENVIKDVYKRWGYEHKSNNVVDAYAIARYLEAENAK
jgi:crossover junction endodeoxyribonuclease RuvC